MIIGSTALKKHFPDLNRKPKDIDIITGTYSVKNLNLVTKSGLRGEELKNPILIKYYNNKCPEFLGKNELYTLKISHTIGWRLENNSFDKHLWDIQFMKERGCVLIKPLFYDLYEYWKTIHGDNKRSNLDMTAEDFFNNAVKCPYNHDYLHELLIKHPYFEGQLEPTYKKILKGEVDVCMDKFQQLSEKEKLNVVYEECFVMEFERNFHKNYKIGFDRMLKKFMLNHAKIEEALWIIQNHKLLLQNLPFNYKEFLNKQIENELHTI